MINFELLYRALQLKVLKCSFELRTLDPTFLSWLENINALSVLIGRLSELAVSAPQENRTQFNRQVAALRAGFKKQQERCVAYLQLTEEYAERFLSDISNEIQQQSSLLDALEKRLDMAKALREEAVQLRKSYEVGTLDCIKKVRHTGVHTSHYMPSLSRWRIVETHISSPI
jgi:hypothetical protein